MPDEKKEELKMVDIQSIYNSSDKLAKEIRMLSRGFKKLSEGGLKRDTILILLQHTTGVCKGNIRAILSAVESLERDYCKPSTQ